MNKSTGKFVSYKERDSKRPISSLEPSFSSNIVNNQATDSGKEGNMNVDDFNLSLDFDDDITSTFSEADFERMEREASKKLGLYQPNGNNMCKTETKLNEHNRNVVTVRKVGEASARTEERSHTTFQASNALVHQSGRTQSVPSELQQLSVQLEEYKSKVKKLENSLYSKDGELKILRNSLEKHRQESAEKSEKIMQLKNKQTTEQNQRESSLMKEVSSLKTRLTFQEQELREQSKKTTCHGKVFGTSSGLKRKAEIAGSTSTFDNSFTSSQLSSGNKKVPRLSKRTENCDTTTTKSHEKDIIDQTIELKEAVTPEVKTDLLHTAECKGLQLAKNLILTNITTNNQDGEPISLLNLLKYPLKHLPDVLEAHSVNCTDGPSQFPYWQSQKVHVSPTLSEKSIDNETLDMDSGKYNLVNQGLSILLGCHGLSKDTGRLDKEVEPSLGVTHVLVFLELYVSSFLVNKKEMEDCYIDGVKSTENEKQILLEDQEMILQSLQLLKVLVYSAPKLVKCILERTNSSVFLLEDVIIIDDDVVEVVQTAAGHIPGCSDCCSLEKPPEGWTSEVLESEVGNGDTAMGSFLSLLLANLEELLNPHSEDSLTISHAALDVLVAMTTVCEKTELERMLHFIKRGCLNSLLSKDSGTLTIMLVISLLKNLLPCEGIMKILCSQTDSCILLKIYQCICDEDDKDTNDMFWNHFLLQVVQFVKSVAFSHSDSVLFLLETDCQCSLEIIRCLVLVLHDKVNYLLGLEPDVVTSDPSLTILRVGVSLLVILCTHPGYSTDHKLDVEHYYIELICKVMILYKSIKDFIPEVEALGVQDLLDLEQIDEIEWSLGSDDEEEECMEIDG